MIVLFVKTEGIVSLRNVHTEVAAVDLGRCLEFATTGGSSMLLGVASAFVKWAIRLFFIW